MIWSFLVDGRDVINFSHEMFIVQSYLVLILLRKPTSKIFHVALSDNNPKSQFLLQRRIFCVDNAPRFEIGFEISSYSVNYLFSLLCSLFSCKCYFRCLAWIEGQKRKAEKPNPVLWSIVVVVVCTIEFLRFCPVFTTVHLLSR